VQQRVAAGGVATVSEFVSEAPRDLRIRHRCWKLLWNSPPLAFESASEIGLVHQSSEPVKKARFILFRRNGVFYSEDTLNGQQTSLRTKDEGEALTLLHAKNEAHRQPAINLQIAKSYLAATDEKLIKRTWREVMEEFINFQKQKNEVSNCARSERAVADPAFNLIRDKPLIETRAEHFLQVLNSGKVFDK
jgi:hypothetical protein